MKTPISHFRSLMTDSRGGTMGIVIAVILVLAVVIAGGYYLYSTKTQKPEPLRTRLTTVKMKADVIAFVHNQVSPALYHNLITTDDVIVMMNKELDRLKRIAKQFPDQGQVIDAQAKTLSDSRDRLKAALVSTASAIEGLYVIWLVDRPDSLSRINSQKGTLTRELANAIREESDLINRIRANPDAL